MLEAIRERGPLPPRALRGRGGGEMWDWKPAKRLLEDLFAAGELVVSGRDGFQRLYDLPERVIPSWSLERRRPGGGVPARLRAAAVAGPRRADRGGHRRALPPPGRGEGMRPVVDSLVAEGSPARRGRRRRPAGRRPGRRELDGAAVRRRAALPLRQPALGPAVRRARLRLRPRDRGLQAASTSGVYGYYVLPLYARPARRPRRLKSDRARACSASRRSTGSPACALRAHSRRRSTGRSPGWRARSSSKPSRDEEVRASRRAGSRCARSCSTARRRGCSRRSGGSASSSSIRSRRSRRPAPRPLEPARAVRPGGARPPALGGAEAVRVDAFIYPVEDLPLLRRGCAAAPDDARERRASRVPQGERRVPPLRAPRAGAARAAALPRDRGPRRRAGSRTPGGATQVALMLDVLEGRGEVAVVGRRRGAAGLGSRRALVPGGRADPVARGAAARSPSSASARSACGSSKRPLAGAPGGERRRRCRTRHAPLAVRPAGPRPRAGPRRSGASTTGWRCTSRRRSASTATTSCRSSRRPIVGRIEPVLRPQGGDARRQRGRPWWERRRARRAARAALRLGASRH